MVGSLILALALAGQSPQMPGKTMPVPQAPPKVQPAPQASPQVVYATQQSCGECEAVQQVICDSASKHGRWRVKSKGACGTFVAKGRCGCGLLAHRRMARGGGCF